MSDATVVSKGQGVASQDGGLRERRASGERPCGATPHEGEQGLGLSTVHISPSGTRSIRTPTVEIARGGQLMRLCGRRLDAPYSVKPRGGTRGKVHGFSRGARRRLMQLLASLNRDEVKDLPQFVTLTYPGEWPGDPKKWKRDLDVFARRFVRKYPNASLIWRLEPQKRGAPHYHLLVFGIAFVPHEWVAQAWYDIVGSGDERHLHAGTQVQALRSWRGVTSYASKYLAKLEDELPEGWEEAGRWWGIINRKALPISMAWRRLTEHQFTTMRRTMRRMLERRVRRRRRWHHAAHEGLWLFLISSEALRLLRYVISVQAGRSYAT